MRGFCSKIYVAPFYKKFVQCCLICQGLMTQKACVQFFFLTSEKQLKLKYLYWIKTSFYVYKWEKSRILFS